MKKISLFALSFINSIILVGFVTILFNSSVGWLGSLVEFIIFSVIVAVAACIPILTIYGWQLCSGGKWYKFTW